MLLTLVFLLALIGGLGLCGLTGAFASMAWLYVLPLGTLVGVVLFGGLAFGFLCLICARVDTNKPQTQDSKLFRTLIPLYIGALIPLLRVRMHTVGLEKTPKEGRFLLVCNHLALMDPVLLLYYFRHSQLAFLSKQENKDMFLIGKIMHRLQCQLVNRENDREALKTILRCINLLKNDKASVAVFPEGYCSRDFKLHPFRAGVLKIALKAKVPIVVCTLRNTQCIFPNAKRLKPTKVELHLVEVLQPEDYQGMTTTELSHRVHGLMAQDLGKDLVLPTQEEP